MRRTRICLSVSSFLTDFSVSWVKLKQEHIYMYIVQRTTHASGSYTGPGGGSWGRGGFAGGQRRAILSPTFFSFSYPTVGSRSLNPSHVASFPHPDEPLMVSRHCQVYSVGGFIIRAAWRCLTWPCLPFASFCLPPLFILFFFFFGLVRMRLPTAIAT